MYKARDDFARSSSDDDDDRPDRFAGPGRDAGD
jgi:hypothetical protein